MKVVKYYYEGWLDRELAQSAGVVHVYVFERIHEFDMMDSSK